MPVFLAVLLASSLASAGCGQKTGSFHRICDGGVEPSEGFLAESSDHGPISIGAPVTSNMYWFKSDGRLMHDEQVELMHPANEDGVDTVIKLCRPWEGACDKCPAIVAFDDNATTVTNKFIYSKLPTLDWLTMIGNYTDEDLHVAPGRPKSRFRICVRSFWAWADSAFCTDNGLEDECEGWFRATCRKAPLPDGGPNALPINEGREDPVNGLPNSLSNNGVNPIDQAQIGLLITGVVEDPGNGLPNSLPNNGANSIGQAQIGLLITGGVEDPGNGGSAP